MANGNVAQVDSTIKLQTDPPYNTSEEINDIRASMARHCCFSDYSEIVSDAYARKLREVIIPHLLAQLDHNDLEAIQRLCEGMVIHPAQPWVLEHARTCYEAKVARAI